MYIGYDEQQGTTEKKPLSKLAIGLIAAGSMCICCLILVGFLFFQRKRYNYKTILTKYIPAKPEINDSEIMLAQFEVS